MQYQSALKANRIADWLIPHDVKWLRYFIDYTGKYGHEVQKLNLVDSFLEKLGSKDQSSGFQKQARHAVEIYFQMKKGPSTEVVSQERFPTAVESGSTDKVKESVSREVNTVDRSEWDKAG